MERGKIYEGTVKRDIYGAWDDCDKGVYIDHDNIETILNEFMGRNIRVTIELVAEDSE